MPHELMVVQALELTEIEVAPDASLFCPACQNTAHKFTNPSSYKLQQCSACGLVFLDTRPKKLTDYALLVEQQHFGAALTENRNYWATLYEAWNNQRTLRRLKAVNKASKKKLLEIGIGSGAFLQAAMEAGWEVYGIEASPELAEDARQRLGIEVFTGYLEEYNHGFGSSFEAVVMNHVLEHIPEPKATLARVRQWLKPDGILHLAVPNVSCWEAQLTGWTSYQPYHLLYFDRLSLGYLLEQCGYEIIAIQHHEPFSGWVNTLMRTLVHPELRMLERQIDAGSSSNHKSSRHRWLRNVFEVSRLGIGFISLPLRAVQATLGKGEELVIMAKPAA